MTKPTKSCERCPAPHVHTIGMPSDWHELCRAHAIELADERPVVFSLMSPSWELLPPRRAAIAA